ncbi:unnamed protein product [Plutella xylostella]|uniref:(diamondback moth) hypothetical protein n=1 Tax=Plutella xylostella TaxID=51655 RepID=A0A8S4GBK7_PLUXY|nr:unnamed protein product [Plutella xylostella]
MPFKLVIHSLLLVSSVTLCLAEEYNLFGFAGLGYAIEIHLGHPPQKLHVLLDTGSSTLAVASVARNDITTYFDVRNSTSAYDIGDEVFAKYTEGDWSAKVVTDYVSIPSVPLAPEVRADIALITNAHDFFMNGSGWQTLGKRFIAGGDWNAKHIHWGSRLTTTRGKELKACLDMKHLVTLSTAEPTHWPGDPKKLPDTIDFFITAGLSRLNFQIESCLDGSSNHVPVILTMSALVMHRENRNYCEPLRHDSQLLRIPDGTNLKENTSITITIHFEDLWRSSLFELDVNCLTVTIKLNLMCAGHLALYRPAAIFPKVPEILEVTLFIIIITK